LSGWAKHEARVGKMRNPYTNIIVKEKNYFGDLDVNGKKI
jgi:hypothetical protein